MGVLSCLGKVVIIALNVVFLIASLGLVVTGLLARFATDFVNTITATAEEALNDQLDQIFVSTTKLNFDLTEILVGLAIGFIVSGLVLGTIAAVGCCGACYKVKVLLLIYAVILTIILIAEAVVVGLVLGTPETVTTPMKDELKVSLEKYKGMSGTNIESLSWNVFMIQVQCCGVESYKDFSKSTDWEDRPAVKPVAASGLPLEMPIACCKLSEIEKIKTDGVSCAKMQNTDKNNMNKGCFDTIWNMFIGNKAIMYGSFAGALGFELLLIIFTLLLFFEDDKKVAAIA